jgi:hypothetical protein
MYFWLHIYDTIDLADNMGDISSEGLLMEHFIVSGVLRRTIVLSKRPMQLLPIMRLSSLIKPGYSTFTTNPSTSLYISAGQPSPSAVT